MKKPSDPRFSCGPTRKFAKWSPSSLKNAPVGRYHRSDAGKVLLAEVYAMTREALSVPEDYHLLTLPGSCTGAITAIMANTLGERPVQAFSQGVFGDTWARDATLFADTVQQQHALCAMPDVSVIDNEADTLWVMNETSVGAKLPNLDALPESRSGLSICDVTSSVFVNPIEWSKTDVAIWSWQKALAGESGFSTVVLSPMAVARVLTSERPQPKLFSLKHQGKLVELVNTLSLLALQDWHFALRYYLKQGGQATYYAAAERKRRYVNDWLARSTRFSDYVEAASCRSDTVVYLRANERVSLHDLLAKLAENNIALDISSHRLTQKGVRFWIGPSVRFDDVACLTDWLELT